jgi:hypothetical protein
MEMIENKSLGYKAFFQLKDQKITLRRKPLNLFSLKELL